LHQYSKKGDKINNARLPYYQEDEREDCENVVRLTFYFKEGCWLCDTAEEMINGLREKYDVRMKKVAIDSDDILYQLYRFDIPVFEFKDGSTLHGRIRKKDLLKKLEENREE